jgi:lipopolysaccharide transport system permease protein
MKFQKSLDKEDDWLYEISAKQPLLDFKFGEIWRYRDLLLLFVKRDIITVYKQTILGPLWYLVQPLFTSVIFTLVFNNLGSISTGGVPAFLFNLAGITAWNYFSSCLSGTSNTFRANAGIFGKVYFPRVITPLSVTLSGLFRFGIQLFIFIVFYAVYYFQGMRLGLSWEIILLPYYILCMALMGLGLGMTISAMTTKYRDLTVLVGFATSLLMYLSAVPYPLSEAKEKFPDWVVDYVVWNPLSQIIEGFRGLLLNQGGADAVTLSYVGGISVFLFLTGLVVFNRTERSFIDTV